MALIKIILKSVLYLFFSFYGIAFEKIPEKIEMRVGDINEIDLKNSQRINLSKKGVVVLSYVGKEKWRLVAHRKGFVVLSYEDKIKHEIKQRFIYVKEKRNLLRENKNNPWFCERKSIKCRDRPFSISGKSDSWTVFYSVKKWCQKRFQDRTHKL